MQQKIGQNGVFAQLKLDGQKIGQNDVLAQLKLEGLLFEHLYSDLMMLVKSKALDKSALDMNVHYFDLKVFLEELTQHPQQIINPNYKVFPSEPRFMGIRFKLNYSYPKSYSLSTSMTDLPFFQQLESGTN